MTLEETMRTAVSTGRPLIMDGATGTELQRRGVPMDDRLWNGLATATHPDILTGIHLDYLRAGSDLIIANTFSTSRFLLESVGLGPRFQELNEEAMLAVLRARERHGQPAWTAGAISSEAFGTGLPDPAVAGRDFAAQAEIYRAAGADLIILEMMRDVELTGAALEGAAATGLPVWIGFSVYIKGTNVVSQWADLPFADMLAGVDLEKAQAVGVMHSETSHTGPALRVLAEAWQGPLFAYAHSGTFEMPEWRFSDIISPADYAAAARSWVDDGLAAVGSCCGLGPEHIGAVVSACLPG